MYVHIRNGNGMLLKVMIFTHCGYYAQAKINAIVKQSNRWNSNGKLKQLNVGLSENHFKQACLVEFESAINFYHENVDCIWHLKYRFKKWSRQKLFLHGTKRSTIAKFVSKLHLHGYETPKMYYGSGSFPAGQRGEKYAQMGEEQMQRILSMYYYQ